MEEVAEFTNITLEDLAEGSHSMETPDIELIKRSLIRTTRKLAALCRPLV